ncbi:MAG: TonB-dependent receptor plug domain-containing protein, partial [Pseudomonadota bacterium]
MTDSVMLKRSTSIAAFSGLFLFVWLGLTSAVASEVVADSDELTVTGSRIPRSDFSTISPITVISRDEILVSGLATLEDVLQDLTYTNGGDWGSTNNLAGFGLATASLRGLGPNRTLILVDGRRMVRAGAEGFVDINSIPLGMIERVEILRDGASTIYGSDAIAGVINVITRDEITGLNVDAGYDVTSEGDGSIQRLAANIGSNLGGLNWNAGVEFTSREEILQQDRGFSACVLSEATGNIACGGSPVTTPSFIVPLADINTIGPHIIDPTSGVTRPFAPTDQFNFAIDSFLTVPQDTTSVYGNASVGLSETLSLSVNVLFNNRESAQQGAPTGTFWGAFV